LPWGGEIAGILLAESRRRRGATAGLTSFHLKINTLPDMTLSKYSTVAHSALPATTKFSYLSLKN
jgi:hypothetical protein